MCPLASQLGRWPYLATNLKVHLSMLKAKTNTKISCDADHEALYRTKNIGISVFAIDKTNHRDGCGCSGGRPLVPPDGCSRYDLVARISANQEVLTLGMRRLPFR